MGVFLQRLGVLDQETGPADITLGIPWANVIMQVPSGVNASTTFVDESSVAHAMAQSGSVQHSNSSAPPLPGETTCINFPGTGYFQANDANDFDLPANYGMDLWIKTTSSGCLMSKFSNNNRAFIMQILTDGKIWFKQYGDKNSSTAYITTATGTSDLRDGLWHHICMTHSALVTQSTKLFVDGVRQANITNSWESDPNWAIDPTTGPVMMGRTTNGLLPWTGKMAWPRIWRDYTGPETDFDVPNVTPPVG